MAAAGIYPAIDLRTSRSRLLETGALGEEHGTVAAQVRTAEALRTCREILEGRYDDVPEKAFYFAGGIQEIRGRLRTGESTSAAGSDPESKSADGAP